MAKKSQVKIGDVWTLRLTTGRMVQVHIVRRGDAYSSSGYVVRQLDSGRIFQIRSAGKLRELISRG